MPIIAIRPGPWWFAPDGQDGDDRPTRLQFRDGADPDSQKFIEEVAIGAMNKDGFQTWELIRRFLLDVENPPEYPGEDGESATAVEVVFDKKTGYPSDKTIANLGMRLRLEGAGAIINRVSLVEEDQKNSD